MNTNIIENRWTALVFGAVSSLLTPTLDGGLIYHTIKSVVVGAIWFGFQVMADRMKRRGEEAAKCKCKKENDNERGEMDSRERSR